MTTLLPASRIPAVLCLMAIGFSFDNAFFASGVHYLSIACDHPNVFRFITVDDPMDTIGEPVRDNRSIFSFEFDAAAANLLAKEYGISSEVIGNTVKDIVIYTHGLAVMMMHDSFRLQKEEACTSRISCAGGNKRRSADIGLHGRLLSNHPECGNI